MKRFVVINSRIILVKQKIGILFLFMYNLYNLLLLIISLIDKKKISSNQQSVYFDKTKNRNIIFISAESIQSFVIDNTLNGQEITPFLNELRTDSDTFYFENFYHQTAQGKTSDSEFITENSL